MLAYTFLKLKNILLKAFKRVQRDHLLFFIILKKTVDYIYD